MFCNMKNPLRCYMFKADDWNDIPDWLGTVNVATDAYGKAAFFSITNADTGWKAMVVPGMWAVELDTEVPLVLAMDSEAFNEKFKVDVPLNDGLKLEAFSLEVKKQNESLN